MNESIDIPDLQTPHVLERVDTSTVIVPTTNGPTKMLKLHLWVVKQHSPDSLEGMQLPPIWIDVTTALTLTQALQSKIESTFPAEVAADRIARTKPQ